MTTTTNSANSANLVNSNNLPSISKGLPKMAWSKIKEEKFDEPLFDMGNETIYLDDLVLDIVDGITGLYG